MTKKIIRKRKIVFGKMCYENLFIDILLHVFLKQEECFIDSGGDGDPWP